MERAVSRRRNRWLLAVLCGSSVAVLAGCPIDDRQLQGALGVAGQAGSLAGLSESGGQNGGTAGGDPDSGPVGGANQAEAGAAGAIELPPPTLVDGCADLDGDGVSDCAETKIINATFVSDVSSWTREAQLGDPFTTSVSWDAGNAWGSVPSGSARVSVSGTVDFNGASLRAATQCLLVQPQELVIVYANANVDVGQDPAGSAEVDVSFFDSSDCSGLSTSTFSTPPPGGASPGAWWTLHAGSPSGTATKSALIELGVVKPFRATSMTARFDNVLVKIQSP
jgi:hypothetical protein